MGGIKVEKLSKRFGDFEAVADVDFAVKQGELAALLGPSGSGKSTILRIAAGLEKPDSGRVYLTGEDVTEELAQNRNIGFVFQHYALFKHMTVTENIAFGMKVRKMPASNIKNKVAELMDLVKLTGYENHYPAHLSGGQRQRVALARALAPEPRVLLLDEPFGALDAKVRENLAEWLRNLHRQVSLTTILVTHDQKEAIEIADRIIVINRGKVEQMGTPREVYEQPESKFVASFIGHTNVLMGINNLPDPFDEPAVVLVRPEDISVSREPIPAEHSLKVRVEHVFYRGNFYEIMMSSEECQFRAVLGKKDYDQYNFTVNETVFASFRDYKFFNAPEGEIEIRRKLAQLGYIE